MYFLLYVFGVLILIGIAWVFVRFMKVGSDDGDEEEDPASWSSYYNLDGALGGGLADASGSPEVPHETSP